MVAFGEARQRIIAAPAPAFPKTVPVPKDVGSVPSVEAWQRLKAAGLPVVDCALAVDAEAAIPLAEGMGFPVAVKIESPDILHKTDMGGVELGCHDANAVRAAADTILQNVAMRAPEARVEGLLVQAMTSAQTEIVLGLRRDPAFGPIIMVGLGGVFVEVLNDVAFAQAPLRSDDAELMLEQLAGKAILNGTRGQPAIDKRALIDTLCALSDFAVENPDVVELDLNPVFAGPDGMLAVDWLMMSTNGRK